MYCTSRFCGPETDALQELADAHADEATFIHIEIWKDYQNSVVNKAAADWLYRDGDLTGAVVVPDRHGRAHRGPLGAALRSGRGLRELAAIPNTGD